MTKDTGLPDDRPRESAHGWKALRSRQDSRLAAAAGNFLARPVSAAGETRYLLRRPLPHGLR
ncbi:hypothetical protein O9H85_20130 [Paenibacillus filicis]|uniref:Uncharacterized protein n=1 Tax=Paenibacillus gyeongsangnamensis TaxID=3388067 RepID=A0ABT4QCT8_9BACL|nr:hypothetical protein [Paenibacillus filicis]MCZ8514692.1 hypothetical protein [Paenibacillus filicis]